MTSSKALISFSDPVVKFTPLIVKFGMNGLTWAESSSSIVENSRLEVQLRRMQGREHTAEMAAEGLAEAEQAVD